MSLRLKTILGVALIEAVLLLILITMTLNYLRSTNYDAIEKHAATSTRLFATTTKDAVLSYDLASLGDFASEILRNPDIVYARVLGPNGEIFASRGKAGYIPHPFVEDNDAAKVTDGVFDSSFDINESDVNYGRVELGFDIKGMSETIKEAEHRSISIALIEMLLVALFSLMLGNYLTRQLKSVSHAAKKIARHDFDFTLDDSGNDEVAEVSKAFNAMKHELEQAKLKRDQFEKQLIQLNKTLEQKVSNRTRELKRKNSELEIAYGNLQSTQRKLIYTEKMASIGVLAAGVAHEINHPIIYVINNLATLHQHIDDLHSALEKHDNLCQLKACSLNEIQQKAHIIECIKQERKLAFSQKDAHELLVDLSNGAERIKSIVQSLKDFSHISDLEETKPSDINECIDAALNMAQSELRDRCELKLNLTEMPLVYCNPGRIQQAILNMVVNASQAVTTNGIITISTWGGDEYIVITIHDNGPGIPNENLDKLFDPFFTTKNIGKGTGLGLAISYGIVQEHNGSIMVESAPEKGTCFTLRLPIAQKN